MLTNLEWDKVQYLIKEQLKELEERLQALENASNKPRAQSRSKKTEETA